MANIRVQTMESRLNVEGYVINDRPVVVLTIGNTTGAKLAMSLDEATDLIDRLPAAIEEARKTAAPIKR